MSNVPQSKWVRVLAFALVICGGVAQLAQGSEPTPSELFDQRIMPIFRTPEPSSCVQCHLSSVDLKNYILPSAEKTFVSLRDQGLIDISQPERSKILTLIEMGEKDRDEGARLIHEQTRRAEYEAFASWIRACCNDPRLRDLPPLEINEQAGPDVVDAVIRHTRKSRVVDSFVRTVWSQRMRCFPCHTPNEIDPSNARQQAAVKTYSELTKKYDDEMLDRLAIFRATPEETLDHLVTRSEQTPHGELPMLNIEDPRRSLLVLKPMSKLPMKQADGTFEAPSYAEPVTHMGGLKMHPDDQTYKAFIAWIQDYANVVSGQYSSVEDLPADNWTATQLVLKLTATPAEWEPQTPVQFFVHAWDDAESNWTAEPVAFTQGTVTPRNMAMGALFLLGSKSTVNPDSAAESEPTLPRGRYLVKFYADTQRRLADDPTLLLGENDYYGQAELKRARWREGFMQAETIIGTAIETK